MMCMPKFLSLFSETKFMGNHRSPIRERFIRESEFSIVRRPCTLTDDVSREDRVSAAGIAVLGGPYPLTDDVGAESRVLNPFVIFVTESTDALLHNCSGSRFTSL